MIINIPLQYLIATAVVIIATVIQTFKLKEWKKKSNFKKFIFIISICASLFIIYLDYRVKEKNDYQEKVKSIVGEIEGNGVKYPRLKIKNSEVYFENKDGLVEIYETDALSQKHSIISVQIINDRLFTDFIFKDSYGNVIAVLNRNAFKIYDSNNYDYNYDDHAIEVITKDQVVVFQLEYKNNLAEFTGFILAQDTTGLFVKGRVDDKERVGETTQDKTSGVVIKVAKNGNFKQYGAGIKRLFRYPRELYLSERETFY